MFASAKCAGQNGEYITVSYTDGSGRKLAIVEEGEVAGTWMVRDATSHNLRGKPQSKWLAYQVSSVDIPHFPLLWPAGRPPQSDGVNPAVVATDFYYDPSGREIEPCTAGELGRAARGRRWRSTCLRESCSSMRRIGGAVRLMRLHHIVEYIDGLSRLIAVEETVKLDRLRRCPARRRLGGPNTPYDLNDQLIRSRIVKATSRRCAYDGLRRMTG